MKWLTGCSKWLYNMCQIYMDFCRPWWYFFSLSLDEQNDIMFFIKNIHHPFDHFDINDFITFSDINTRFSSSFKLKHTFTNSTSNIITHLLHLGGQSSWHLICANVCVVVNGITNPYYTCILTKDHRVASSVCILEPCDGVIFVIDNRWLEKINNEYRNWKKVAQQRYWSVVF